MGFAIEALKLCGPDQDHPKAPEAPALNDNLSPWHKTVEGDAETFIELVLTTLTCVMAVRGH